MDQGQMHVVLRSNHVHLPLIDGESGAGAAGAADGAGGSPTPGWRGGGAVGGLGVGRGYSGDTCGLKDVSMPEKS
jgi:hypothetical protein